MSKSIFELLGATNVTLYELYHVSADELARHQGTIGWFRSEAAAKLTQSDLNNSYTNIRSQELVQLPDGRLFRLKAEPIAIPLVPRDVVKASLARHGAKPVSREDLHSITGHLINTCEISMSAAAALVRQLVLEHEATLPL